MAFTVNDRKSVIFKDGCRFPLTLAVSFHKVEKFDFMEMSVNETSLFKALKEKNVTLAEHLITLRPSKM